MNKKYEMILERQEVFHRDMFRIKALRSFSDVKEGDLGGLIDKEDNLSHEGDCWVYNNAKVWDDARISENAQIRENAFITCESKVYGNAIVGDMVQIHDRAQISDNVQLFNFVQVYGDAQVSGCVRVGDHVYIGNKAKVGGYTQAYTSMHILGKCTFTPMFLTFDRVNVTITDSHIHIEDYSAHVADRQQKDKPILNLNNIFRTISKWKEYTDAQIKRLGILEWWKKWKSVIFNTIEIRDNE